MPTSPDPFDEFLRQLNPLIESRKLPFDSESLPFYEALEFSCIAARHGSQWVLVSGKAVLRIAPYWKDTRIERVAALDDLVALRARLLTGELNTLIANLRRSWVLKNEKVRLTLKGGADYNWIPPRVVALPWAQTWCEPTGVYMRGSNGRGNVWDEIHTPWLALCGTGPNTSLLLSDRTLQKINSQLRSSRPAFNGLDGLCGKIGLPVPRGNLATSFNVFGELPAVILAARLADGALHFVIGCVGAPDLMVEWFPARQLQRVRPGWNLKSFVVDGFYLVGVPILEGSQGAKLIISFGEMQACASTVYFPVTDMSRTDAVDLCPVHEHPPVFEFETQATANEEGDIASKEAPSARKPPQFPKYRSELKIAIFEQIVLKKKTGGIEICKGLDQDGVAPPEGYKEDPESRFYEKAYNGTDEGLKQYIWNSIYEVQTDLRRLGWA